MPHNFIFMGLHFTISKCESRTILLTREPYLLFVGIVYCNSVLAKWVERIVKIYIPTDGAFPSLNTRQALRDRQTVTVARPLMNSGEINFALELIPRGVPVRLRSLTFRDGIQYWYHFEAYFGSIQHWNTRGMFGQTPFFGWQPQMFHRSARSGPKPVKMFCHWQEPLQPEGITMAGLIHIHAVLNYGWLNLRWSWCNHMYIRF